jgi:hypothetical protein
LEIVSSKFTDRTPFNHFNKVPISQILEIAELVRSIEANGVMLTSFSWLCQPGDLNKDTMARWK